MATKAATAISTRRQVLAGAPGGVEVSVLTG